MTLDVRVGSGTGFELLAAAVAVADRDWRQVFTHGQEAYVAVRRGDPDLVAATRRFGRYGWINLAGPLAANRASWTRAGLARLVESMPADELRWTMAGGRRRQLRSRIGEEQVRAALAGDRAARRALRVALADSLLDVTPWLMRTDADELHRTCLRILNDLPVVDRRPSTVATTAALEELGAERLLERVAPGISYGPGVLDRVVLVTSARTVPILVAVDEDDQTVILHPPIADGGGTDATSRLREIGRALGDDTRIRVLQQLRAGDRTLAELCAALTAPRTTLLHHLAMLRSAGLVGLRIRPGAEPNLYSINDTGFESLATAARAFTTR